jgi:hypothetical protein
MAAPPTSPRKPRRRRIPFAGSRRPSYFPYYDVALQAARDALHERLVHDFWEYLQRVREERPEIREAEELIGRAITEYFSPENIKARHARERRRKRRAKKAK